MGRTPAQRMNLEELLTFDLSPTFALIVATTAEGPEFFEFRHGTRRLLRFIFISMFISHFMACGWHVVARIEEPDFDGESNIFTVDEDGNIAHLTWITGYFQVGRNRKARSPKTGGSPSDPLSQSHFTMKRTTGRSQATTPSTWWPCA